MRRALVLAINPETEDAYRKFESDYMANSDLVVMMLDCIQRPNDVDLESSIFDHIDACSLSVNKPDGFVAEETTEAMQDAEPLYSRLVADVGDRLDNEEAIYDAVIFDGQLIVFSHRDESE